MSEPSRTVNLRAAATVYHHALNEDDKQQLLEMVGLVAPGTLTPILPDDNTVYALVDAGPTPGVKRDR